MLDACIPARAISDIAGVENEGFFKATCGGTPKCSQYSDSACSKVVTDKFISIQTASHKIKCERKCNEPLGDCRVGMIFRRNVHIPCDDVDKQPLPNITNYGVLQAELNITDIVKGTLHTYFIDPKASTNANTTCYGHYYYGDSSLIPLSCVEHTMIIDEISPAAVIDAQPNTDCEQTETSREYHLNRYCDSFPVQRTTEEVICVDPADIIKPKTGTPAPTGNHTDTDDSGTERWTGLTLTMMMATIAAVVFV